MFKYVKPIKTVYYLYGLRINQVDAWSNQIVVKKTVTDMSTFGESTSYTITCGNGRISKTTDDSYPIVTTPEGKILTLVDKTKEYLDLYILDIGVNYKDIILLAELATNDDPISDTSNACDPISDTSNIKSPIKQSLVMRRTRTSKQSRISPLHFKSYEKKPDIIKLSKTVAWFGKHQGKTYAQIYKNDIEYANWAETQYRLSADGPLHDFGKYIALCKLCSNPPRKYNPLQ